MTTSHGSNPRCKFVQNGRLGTHHDNVHAASPRGYTAPGSSEVHHILPHSCVQEAAIVVSGTDEAFVKKCLAITDWDVNNPKNLIGLPRKNAYLPAPGRYVEHALWDRLPCHQHDHPAYTEAVKKWLQNNVWSTLKGKVDTCDVDPKCVKDLLDKGSKHWQTFLLSRGAMLGGTKLCWDERNKMKRHTWFIPFSMHPGPAAVIPRRRAPPDDFTWNGKLGSILRRIT